MPTAKNRIIALIFGLLLVIATTACGSDNDQPGEVGSYRVLGTHLTA